jgi:uncharacterized protein GlcG (DUF336 family)
MIKKVISVLLSGTMLLLGASLATAQTGPGTALPGDPGRFRDGILPSSPPAGPPPGGMQQKPVARAPNIGLAVQAAQAIAEGCKQFKNIAIAVANSEGMPILVYVPDGSDPSHGYTTIRKAYSAIVFKGPTTPNIDKARSNPAFAAEVKADPNLMAFKGGIPLMVGNDIIGAIGVSGAEPGGHDDECGQIGVDKIKGQLK